MNCETNWKSSSPELPSDLPVIALLQRQRLESNVQGKIFDVVAIAEGASLPSRRGTGFDYE